MAYVLPEDVCGVPGGNGTSCLDDCGIANGDGTSCAEQDDLNDGDDEAFGICVHSGAARPERQTVRLSMSEGTTSGMLGTYRLRFGGETTEKLSLFASAATIETALEVLGTVGEGAVAVVGLIGDSALVYNETADGSSVAEVYYGLSFRSALLTDGSAPQNLGPLPTVVEVASTSSITGGFDSAVTKRSCAGRYPSGYDYAEQLISVSSISSDDFSLNLTGLAAAGARFTLALNGSTGTTADATCATSSSELATGWSAEDLTTALLPLSGGITAQDIEVFLNASTDHVFAFTVRFYTRAATALTGCTALGVMPELAWSPSDALARTRLDITVRIVSEGLVPEADMPIDAASEAEASGEAAVAAAAESGTSVDVIPVRGRCAAHVISLIVSLRRGFVISPRFVRRKLSDHLRLFVRYFRSARCAVIRCTSHPSHVTTETLSMAMDVPSTVPLSWAISARSRLAAHRFVSCLSILSSAFRRLPLVHSPRASLRI